MWSCVIKFTMNLSWTNYTYIYWKLILNFGWSMKITSFIQLWCIVAFMYRTFVFSIIFNFSTLGCCKKAMQSLNSYRDCTAITTVDLDTFFPVPRPKYACKIFAIFYISYQSMFWFRSYSRLFCTLHIDSSS